MSGTAFNPNQAFDPVPGEFTMAVIPLAAQNTLNGGNLTAWNQSIQLLAPTLNEVPGLTVLGNVLTLPRGRGVLTLSHTFHDIGIVVARGKLRYRLSTDLVGSIRHAQGYSRNTGANASLGTHKNTDSIVWPVSVLALTQPTTIQTGRGGNGGTLTTLDTESFLTILWRALPF